MSKLKIIPFIDVIVWRRELRLDPRTDDRQLRRILAEVTRRNLTAAGLIMAEAAFPHGVSGGPREQEPAGLDRERLHERRPPKIIRRILYPAFSQAFWLPPLQKVSQQFPSARSIFLQPSR
jgi:hypothetical protein